MHHLYPSEFEKCGSEVHADSESRSYKCCIRKRKGDVVLVVLDAAEQKQ